MKALEYSFLLLFIVFLGCNKSEVKVIDFVPRGENPETPSKASLDAQELIPFETLRKEVKLLDSNKLSKRFYYNDQLYSGWAHQYNPDSESRNRYLKFENGALVWHIGYFDNGNLELDFHLKDDVNYGSQRMWRRNGEPYSKTYYLEGGIMNGMQYEWYAGNVLSKEANYRKGKKIYEVLFFENGQKKEVTGKLPAGYKPQTKG